MVRIGGAAARSSLAIASVAATLSFAPRPAAAAAAAACYAPDRSLVRIPDDAEAGCRQNEVAAELEAGGIRWRGVWNARRTYAANDAVHFKGAAFIAIRESKGVRPTDESPWDLLAAKGAEGDRGPGGVRGDRGATGEVGPRGGTGAKGETGPAGPQGVAGREGVSGPAGPQGPAGVQGPAGPGGVTGGTSGVTSDTVGSFGASVSQIFLATPKFTPSRDMSCLVIATVQLSDPSPPAAGNAATFVKVAFDNGFGSRDDQRDDQAYVSTGVAGRQPSVTRSSVFAVSAGREARFGVSLKNPGAWSGATAFVQASHFCS